MANEIAKINRKLKAAAKRLIDDNDPRAISAMINLANERQKLLAIKQPQPKNAQPPHQ